MIPLENWVAFSLSSIVLLAIPGPTVLTVVGHSLTHGRQAGRPLLWAVFLGDSTAAALALAGVGLLVQESDIGLRLLQVAGGLFLVYLGVDLALRPNANRRPSASAAPKDGTHLFKGTYLVTALNPKGLIFFSTVLPTFVRADRPVVLQWVILAATFIGLATISAGVWAEVAVSTRAMVVSAQRASMIHRAVGSLLVLLGLLTLAR